MQLAVAVTSDRECTRNIPAWRAHRPDRSRRLRRRPRRTVGARLRRHQHRDHRRPGGRAQDHALPPMAQQGRTHHARAGRQRAIPDPGPGHRPRRDRLPRPGPLSPGRPVQPARRGHHPCPASGIGRIAGDPPPDAAVLGGAAGRNLRHHRPRHRPRRTARRHRPASRHARPRRPAVLPAPGHVRADHQAGRRPGRRGGPRRRASPRLHPACSCLSWLAGRLTQSPRLLAKPGTSTPSTLYSRMRYDSHARPHRPGFREPSLADSGTLREGEGIVSATVAPPAVLQQRLGRIGRRGIANGLPPLIAFICGWLLIASQVPHGLAGVVNPNSFARWDSAWYQRIASHGYRLRFHCHDWHHTVRPGVHLCASVTWFPGYPLLMRAVSVTGISLALAGVMIAWIFWYLTLLMIWLLSEPTPERPVGRWGTPTRWLCLLIAAFFPGEIYFAAIYPISMAAFGMLACCYWSARVPNRTLAAIAGLIAGSAYLPTVAVIPGLVIAAVVTKDRRARAAMCFGAGG